MSNRVNRKALYIGIGCMFFQQATGINAIVFYMAGIFEATGSSVNPKTATIIVSAVQVGAVLESSASAECYCECFLLLLLFFQLFMTFVTMSMIDKMGRRKLLTLSGIVMGISHMVLAFFYFYYEQDPSRAAPIDWIPLVSVTTFVSAYALGFGPIPWVVMGEIFSDEVRTRAPPRFFVH